jgi:SAM-dependent methyltransferase
MIPVFTVRDKKALLDTLITKHDVVLDVGFWGQAKTQESDTWPHRMLRERAKEVWGVDPALDEQCIPASDLHRYSKAPAESFSFSQKFDVIFLGDVIEHLVNPGLFLENARKHLAPGGRLVMTTPNTFNLYNIAGKLTRTEPVVNADHTCYFNTRTLQVLLEKCDFSVQKFGFMYTLDYTHVESLKKKVLNLAYYILSLFTPKFYETLVVVAVRK